VPTSQPLGPLVKRLDAAAQRSAKDSRRISDRQRDAFAKLLAVIWRIVQDAGRFWENLPERDKRTLRFFFAKTKGDPRRIVKRPADERAEVARIFRDGLSNLAARSR
jgi:hypothetical protein